VTAQVNRFAAAALGSWGMPFLGMGEAVDDFTDGTDPDQPSRGGVIAWRHSQ